MTDRLLVDLAADGRVSVSTWLNGELPDAAGGPSDLAWPLDEEALEDLRWYLEDYLRAPFGVYEERGPRVQERLAGWGGEIFAGVFGSGAARDAYVRARASGRPVEVVFRSDSAGVLGLPWELMADPGRGAPLALDVAGMSRSLPARELGAPFEVTGGRLRVLMVISRPHGGADVGFRMIARPLLGRLAVVRGQVDLVVLRPPGLDALREALTEAAAAGEPFQVVHFDGHGALAGRGAGAAGAGAPGMYGDPAGEGVLVFQKPDGSADYVGAAKVAAVLAEGRVPVVVLNACQSGAVGKEVEAAVATRLLRDGAASVVAMAYSVYATAAAEFMTAFYEALFAGEPVSTAVTAGRRRLFSHDERPSPKGAMPLADWMVPVHYWRREVRFPGLAIARPAALPSLEEALDELRDPAAGGPAGATGGEGGFVGRDGLFYDLETAARLQRVVVLHGPGGTGKTELARAFAGWWQATGGVEQPGWVFWHSFEPGAATFGLDSVVNEIGLQLFGEKFALLDPGERTELLVKTLRERRMLLVWDNFETVQTMPDPDAAAPALDEAGCAALRRFVDKLAAPGGRTAVLVTSRTAEDWLGPVRRLRVSGLDPEEAAEYAGILLAPYPAAGRRRAGRVFGELMEWLDGHPLSMRIILPLLDSTGPGELLAGLRGTAPLPGPSGGDRTTSLPASITYSFRHLGEAARRLLPAASLCQAVASADLLTAFSADPGVPGQFGGADRDTWAAVLEEAARVGLLTGLGSGMYRMHPALPGYLAAHWKAGNSDAYDADRSAATQAMINAAAALAGWGSRQIDAGNAGFAYQVTGLQHGTFGAMLGQALDRHLWQLALLITAALESWWTARGMTAEADAWADRIRVAAENPAGTPPPLDSDAGALWIFTAGAQANRQQRGMRLDDADTTYQHILAMLQAQLPSPEQQAYLATAYHQLGITAQQRRRLDEADEWYRKSLAISEDRGDRTGLVTTYHQLGTAAYLRGRLDEADEWYRKSLTISEDLGDRPGLAATYYQLGMTAQERGRLDEADEWSRKSLAIEEDLGNRPGLASSYHQLGITAQQRGRLDEADEWYRKSLTIKEALGNRPGLASSYHQLGITAQERGRLDEADEWYRKSLTINEDLGNPPGLATSYHQLGTTAYLRGRLDEADEWYRKSLTIKEALGNRPGLASSYHQLGITAQQRGRLDEADEWYRKSLTISEDLGNRPYIATIYHQLGMTAQERGRLDEADEWYRKSLTIREDLGNRPGLAATYHQLGITAQERGRLDEADEWYRKSLTIGEDLGSRPILGRTCAQLALLAEKQGQDREALHWAIRSVSLFSEIPHPSTGTAPAHLARLTTRLGISTLQNSWQEITGSPLPQAVRDYISSNRPGADS